MSYDFVILLTVLVAIAGGVASLLLPRRYALVPLALSLCLYPSNVLLPPDGAGLTPQRVIGAVLILRCLFSKPIRQAFRWQIIDTVAATYFGLLLLAQLLSMNPQTALVNRAGFFLSAMVPFWCTRMLITDREALYALLKGWIWGAYSAGVRGLLSDADRRQSLF